MTVRKNCCGLCLIASLSIVQVHAEEQHDESQIEEIVVSAPFQRTVAETALPVGVLSGEALQERVASSIGETLQDEIGVANASFGTGVGHPVIRGQSGNRVKVLQNGAGVTDAANVSPDHANGVEVLTADRLEIIRGLHGHTTGLAVPMYMIDAPGGGGKVPLTPDYIEGREGDELLIRNYRGERYRYYDPG